MKTYCWIFVYVVQFFSMFAQGAFKSKLTTVSIRSQTTTKPPVIHNREFFYPDYMSQNESVESNKETRRRDLTDAWKWDGWCRMQAKQGDCESFTERYYYDVQNDACSKFNYSGCDRNKNNFGFQVDCERHCKGSYLMKLEDLKAPIFCGLQKDPGRCLALKPSFYYDINKHRCVKFNYSGCGGNQNRFESRRDCRRTCNDYLDVTHVTAIQ